MPFKKNDIRINRAGRPPGKAKQSDIKQAYQNLIEDNLPKVENWLNNVAKDNPAKALEFVLKLSEFVIPRMKATEPINDFNSEAIIELTPTERDTRITELKRKLIND